MNKSIEHDTTELAESLGQLRSGKGPSWVDLKVNPVKDPEPPAAPPSPAGRSPQH